MEVTTSTKALRCKWAAVAQLGDRADCKASERRAGLENVNAETAPPSSRERLPATGHAYALSGTQHRSPPPVY